MFLYGDMKPIVLGAGTDPFDSQKTAIPRDSARIWNLFANGATTVREHRDP